MRIFILVCAGILFLCISGYAQESQEYKLLVGEFDNESEIANPLLSFIDDTLSFLFSRSQLANIHPITPGLRSAYLQRAQNEQPDANYTELALLAGEYAKSDAVLVGSYSKSGPQLKMDAQLYIMRGGSRAREDIQLMGEDVYRLLDSLAEEVGKRLGTGQYMLLSTPSWEAYEAYRKGHKAYYNFDMLGSVNNFREAIESDPQLAIAYAELGMTYLMLNNPEEAEKALEEANKNLKYANENEQFVVRGLVTHYQRNKTTMPHMRDDMVWDEPWLHLTIARYGEDESLRNDQYKQWLTSVRAYAEAGFYDALELANMGMAEMTGRMTSSGTGRGTLVQEFYNTENPVFLEAALQLVKQAANLNVDDEYDSVWMHWQSAKIYDIMDKATDAQQQRKQWLQAVKKQKLEGLPSENINDIARKCLEIGLLEDALDFASKGAEMASNPELHAECVITIADIYSASDDLDQALEKYVEAFEISARGNAGTRVLIDSLSGLTKIITTNPNFMNDAGRAELNEILESIKNMDPLLFRSDTASRTIGGVVFKSTNDFCHAMGDMGPAIAILRGMLEAETDQSEQLVFLRYIYSLGGSLIESELKLFESNQLENGDFESVSTNPWAFYGSGSMKVVTDLAGASVPENPAEGNSCLHITVSEAGVNSWDSGLSNTGYTLKKGKIYTLSAWLKAKKGEFDIRFRQELAVEPYTGYGAETITMTDTWAEYHITTPPIPETVPLASITFHFAFKAGEFWIDNVKFYEGEYVPTER